MEDWRKAIEQWRALPPEEKLRRRWESIPRKVARSFAFEGEPVDLAALEREHGKRPMPLAATGQGVNQAVDSSPVCQFQRSGDTAVVNRAASAATDAVKRKRVDQ